jgi:hypothetical protein
MVFGEGKACHNIKQSIMVDYTEIIGLDQNPAAGSL